MTIDVRRANRLVETKHQSQCVIDCPHCVAMKSHDCLTESAHVEGGNLIDQYFRSIAKNLDDGSHSKGRRQSGFTDRPSAIDYAKPPNRPRACSDCQNSGSYTCSGSSRTNWSRITASSPTRIRHLL